ncbi:MAG: ribonuclease HII [Firmicutes bacterium]|nr:ribonuclease HII [Bacillota bacterium]
MKTLDKTLPSFEFDGFFGENAVTGSGLLTVPDSDLTSAVNKPDPVTALICGVDEAGRGPLAGPVVCAACIMPRAEGSLIPGINDSKQVSEALREELYGRIIKSAIAYSVAVIDNQTIDEINILEATKRGMEQAILSLKVCPDVILVDAVKGLNVNRPYTALIKGDEKSYAVAAASIIAKVTRDRLMREADTQFPEYGFAQNKGYGTAAHIEAFKEFGKTPLHRETFIRKLNK